jgi:hypothetical protein
MEFCGFCRGFCEKWLVSVVFLWTRCGGRAGKAGHWTARFKATIFLQDFEIYFAWASAVRAEAFVRG